MARPSKPWYRTDRGVWMVTIRRVVHNLGPDKDAAMSAFHTLMAGLSLGSPPPPAGPTAPPAITLGELLSAYLDYVKGRISVGGFRVTRVYLTGVKNLLGDDTSCSRISTRDVERVVLGSPSWGPGTQRLVLGRLSTMFRWGVMTRRIFHNPVESVDRPPAPVRGLEAAPDKQAVEKLLVAARPALRAVLEALYDTGARPSEVTSVTRKEFDPLAKVWKLAVHKTLRSTGRPRIIHLTDRVASRCSKLAAEFPNGPLYRREDGEPWADTRQIAGRFRRLRRTLGLGESIIPYGLRHAFAGDALVRGIPDAVVATLLGHTDTRMVNATYGHLTERSQVLRQALARIRGQSSQSAQSGPLQDSFPPREEV